MSRSKNTLSTEFAPRPKLVYPFGLRWAPEPGELHAVAPGIHWLRMPLPMALDHVNIWLLKDGNGWCVVDTGLDHPACIEAWQQVLESTINPKDITRIIVSHFHPDHIGLAAWLVQQCNCPILITQTEFKLYREIIERDAADYASEVRTFTTELGYSQTLIESFVRMLSTEQKPAERRVQSSMVEFIGDGDEIIIDGAPWQVITGSGHSPEHACLWNAERNVFVAGDQAIARISSNVSVYPSNRYQDPLGDWLSSCQKLSDQLPNDALILPGHQEPFIGIQQRMQQMVIDHDAQLNRLRLAIDAPISVVQARGILFDRELNEIETLLASGETLAHLNYLMHRKEISTQADEQGVIRFLAA